MTNKNLFMKLQDYFPQLSEKKILLSEIGINPRTYNAWKEEGIVFNEEETIYINDKKEKRKWVYLDVFEALWLLIIVELRKFNLDLKTIKKLKEFLKENPDGIAAIKSLSEKDFQKKIMNIIPKELLESIGGTKTKEEFIKSLPPDLLAKNIFLTNLGISIYGALINKTFPSIIIKLNKEIEEFEFFIAINNHFEDERKDELYKFYVETCSASTFINVPIATIIARLFENEKIFDHCYDYGFFNNQEKQLFEAIRNKECDEIKIVKHQSGDYTVNFSDTKEISGEEAKILRRTLGLKMYDRVEVIFRNENHLIIKNNNKKIIKP